MKSWGEQNKRWNLFVSRFFECPFCIEDDKKREDEVAECLSAYLEHYEFAFCRFHRCAAPHIVFCTKGDPEPARTSILQ